MADLVTSTGGRAGSETQLPVYSVTKHAGFVPSREYFKKQVFSRDVANYKMVERGDFAYATIHLDEGSIGIAPERGLISPMYTVFRADAGCVDSGYLLRFLKSPFALARYSQLGRGAIHRRKAISLEALGGLPVPLPSLDEQRRIAAILDHTDALRAKRREVLAHLDDLTQSTFRDMVGAAPQDELSAGELMPHMRNGVSPATNGQHLANVLTLSAVTRGRFDPGAVKEGRFVTDPPDDKRVRRTDFLMCRGNGNAALVGVGAFASEDRMDLVFPDTVIAGRVDTSKVLLPILQMAWQQRDVRRQIEAASRTTNGTYKVNQKSLGAVRLRIPSMDVQVAFAAVASRVQAQSAEVSAALMRDDELFASLQSRAFTGEL